MPKVLVADWSEYARDIVFYNLKRKNYEVIGACNSEQVFSAIRQEGIDIIVTEIFGNPHDITDRETHAGYLKKLKETTITAKIKENRVIVLTSKVMYEEDCLAHCFQFMRKPYGLEELMEKVSSAQIN